MTTIENAIRRLRPGDRLSHTSAATWLGVPLPRGLPPEVHVTSGDALAQVRRSGVRGHRDDDAWAMVRGVPVSRPERLFIELGALLGLDDLVAAGDHLVHAPRFAERGRPWSTISRLELAAEETRRGAHAARLALPHVRSGVESPMETALRLLLVRSGLPEPICGFELKDASGRRIGWFDLAWPERRVLGEYDGDQHRTSTTQYEKDIVRFDRAADARWRVLRVRAAGMTRAGRVETVGRFAAALP